MTTRIELHRKAYLERLVIQGYSITGRGEYEYIINRFCEEFGNFPPGKQKVDGVAIEVLRETVLNGLHERKSVCAKYRLGRFIDYLAEAGAIPPLEPPAKEAAATDELFSEYGDYLRNQRGLSESTIYHCMGFSKRFMVFRFGDGLGNLNAITPDDIASFLQQIRGRSRTQPYRCKTPPSHLRNFFKFLFWSGKTKQNLANSVPRIAQPQPTTLPRYLKPEEVERLLTIAQPNNAIGRRNYAVLLLLARLGLRAIEVVAIQLKDIDWRAGEILIRGKGKLHDRMPLPDEVGAAIVNYIQNGRRGDSRALFVSERPPHQAFKDAQIINAVVINALENAGLESPQKYIGSHLLRHSLATNMLAKGASLEEISHVLRHRSRMTTTIYAKCNIGALRSIAQEWPMEGGAL